MKNEVKNDINLYEFITYSVNDINKIIVYPATNSLTEIDPFDNYEDENEDETKDEYKNKNKDKNENKDEDNIVLEIEELDLKEDPNLLKEFDLNSSLVNSLDTFTLKKPNQVYYDIYKKARDKAKEAKKVALTAYLELKEIKKTYMIDNIDDSDSDLEVYSDNESETESEYM